ncbi:hypothetical protein V8E53_000634 [Lactarius tabidus]
MCWRLANSGVWTGCIALGVGRFTGHATVASPRAPFTCTMCLVSLRAVVKTRKPKTRNSDITVGRVHYSQNGCGSPARFPSHVPVPMLLVLSHLCPKWTASNLACRIQTS